MLILSSEKGCNRFDNNKETAFENIVILDDCVILTLKSYISLDKKNQNADIVYKKNHGLN